jgi:TetR/AcrR family transcriptional regulator, transcriptional repressor for nem operon
LIIQSTDHPSSHPTRDTIIHVAMKLFAEKGYDSTSVADILSQANVNSGSLYHYFATKQGVLIAVLETYRDGIERMLIAPAWEGVPDPIGRVFALLDRYRQLLTMTDCSYGCPIGSLALEIHEPDPPVRALLAANFGRWTDFVESCLAGARDRLPPQTNTRRLAEFVLTTMEGGVMLSRTYRNIEPFDAAVATLKDYFSRLESSNKQPNRRKQS